MEIYIDRPCRVCLFSSKHYKLSMPDYSKAYPICMIGTNVPATVVPMLNITHFRLLIIIVVVSVREKFKRHKWRLVDFHN